MEQSMGRSRDKGTDHLRQRQRHIPQDAVDAIHGEETKLLTLEVYNPHLSLFRWISRDQCPCSQTQEERGENINLRRFTVRLTEC